MKFVDGNVAQRRQQLDSVNTLPGVLQSQGSPGLWDIVINELQMRKEKFRRLSIYLLHSRVQDSKPCAPGRNQHVTRGSQKVMVSKLYLSDSFPTHSLALPPSAMVISIS